ncbi:PEPxxWA-CTERM sorting domain-containing protein [Sphingomonas sp. RHCKR7]|uniref:PEPxxWA-CTERM sorting domain-containing protein n=1 Tax=Sphingomonas folli TaxID=2862497 RepID=UPI001CA4CCFD|nr:PEPxxWA-CTERM sorting domain-containing protein [Sphingomonas folli]MBW6526306.1 PEPxxWA-CTERM sorting domain-containing protein [Sphingomonas folli]
MVAAFAIVATPACATDIKFSFEGTQLTGVLYGLTDGGTSTPTNVVFTSAPYNITLDKQLKLYNGRPTAKFPGVTLSGGAVTAAQVKLSMSDENQSRVTLLMKSTTTPGEIMGDLDFSEHYSDGTDGGWKMVHAPVHFTVLGSSGTQPLRSAVPEPSSWTLMILGFGIIGYTSRYRGQRRRGTQLA